MKKRTRNCCVCLTLIVVAFFNHVVLADNTESKLQGFRDDKFGLFVHWGPSSIMGVEISWARQDHPYDHPGNGPFVPNEMYDLLYRSFNPVKFDADKWMKLAKEAGFRYVVFTSKHHDGFSMWHTKLRDYNIANTPFERDICKELADAAHKYGLKLGWYYSTRDWSHPDYLVGDNKKYNDFYEGQIRELLTHYGKVDMMWFDHAAGRWSDYTFERLFDMMYSLQGETLLVNNRAARFVKGAKDSPPGPAIQELVRGDYDTPEQKIGKFQTDRAWESCMTMTKVDGGGWSYRPDGKTISYEETLQTGRVCYWSRSRKKLWRKGEESGNIQELRGIYFDCDADTLLVRVEQIGGAACHEGYRSCFFRRIDPQTREVTVQGKRVFDPAEVYKKG